MTHRTLFDITLVPVQGTRFQPTGFPDLGPAVFDRPNGRHPDGSTAWQKALLVESAQSMANHLEAVGWDTATNTPVAAIAGLPWVRVRSHDGVFLTSSRLESHRLAASFVKDASLDGNDMKVVIKDRLGLADDTPLVPRDIAAAVFHLDPLCLLHGVFFAESAKVWPGQPKIERAVTACVEAHDVRRAESGGVKRDAVSHSSGEGQDASGGYGSIPFARTEWTAGRIALLVSIDDAQICSYGLSPEATELLSAIARWELRGLLDGGLRLRTACDLRPEGDVGDLPPLAALEADIARLLPTAPELDGVSPVLDVVWVKKGAKR